MDYDHIRQAWPLTEERIMSKRKKPYRSRFRIACRDCDMTAEEVEERLAVIRKTNPDYTENDFWCDHERDSCPGGA